QPLSLRVGDVTIPGILVAASAAALLLTVLLLFFLFSRAGSKAKNVLRVETDGGRTTVDRNVADAVLTAPLAARPDVISARSAVHTVRRAPAVELVVTVRRGASLAGVLAAAESAVRDWDALLGVRTPVMVHLADRGWRDSLRSRRRVR
ncbi:hypothetical protein IPV10_15280, partial [Microbacterium sp. SD291]|nr:hypothetical protein [Microbacterium sp. SD291]